jgi:hypothetical protein
LDFELEDILSGKLIEPLFILVDLNLNFYSLGIVIALQLAPKSLNPVKPELVRVMRVVLEIVAVNSQLWHHDASRNALDESHEFLYKPAFVGLAVFGEVVASLNRL